MIKEEITEKAARLWKKYEERNPRRLCELLDIGIDEFPMGREKDSIKGLILKNSRCYQIELNSDLPEKEKDFILLHEIAHYCLGHTEESPCILRYDSDQASKDTKEVEANEFVAEYQLDNERTVEVLQESDTFFEAASSLHVPAEILDYKCRILSHYHLLSLDVPIYSKSDCMGHLDFNVDDDYDDFP